MEKTEQVRFHQRQGHLTFGVSKAYVEFDHVRVVMFVDHQPDEKHTAVGCFLTGEMSVHGFHDALDDLLMDGLGNHWSGAIRTHAPGVWPLVAVVGSLVVLARGERAVGGAVHHDQHARFLAR